ncbi:MAG: hypothetical protein QXI92_02500 [Candidatus Nitrosocaldus sp.]
MRTKILHPKEIAIYISKTYVCSIIPTNDPDKGNSAGIIIYAPVKNIIPSLASDNASSKDRDDKHKYRIALTTINNIDGSGVYRLIIKQRQRRGRGRGRGKRREEERSELLVNDQ